MISVDEIALVKDRVSGIPNLPTSAVSSLRQLELMFLVAHDEVQRLEKFESRARLVAEKWELLKSAKQIAKNQLPAGFSSVISSNDKKRCHAALEILYGPDYFAFSATSAGTPTNNNNNDQQNNNNNRNALTLDAGNTPPPKVATPRRKRQPHPSVYVDDEFSYDDINTTATGEEGYSPNDGESNDNMDYNDIKSSKPPPPPSLSPVGSRTTSPNYNNNNTAAAAGSRSSTANNNTNNNNNTNTSVVDEMTASFLDTLCCCKFISALPKVVFELSFHREGDYASVALAAALDELKLFESQLRSSQESFENLRTCWNHELESLSRSTGVDLFDARVIALENQRSSSNDRSRSGSNNTNNKKKRSSSENNITNDENPKPEASLDQLAPCESADGKSWLAPPLMPLRQDLHIPPASELFAGYCGPTLLGHLSTRSALRDQIAILMMQGLESEESSKRSEIEIDMRDEAMEMLSWKSFEAESSWNDALYEKTAVNLKLLESKEELRHLRKQVGAMSVEAHNNINHPTNAGDGSSSGSKEVSPIKVDASEVQDL